MKPTFLQVLGGLTLLTTSVFATSSTLVKNYLPGTIYLTLYHNGTTNGPFALSTAEAYLTDIIGEGNTCTVTKNADIWAADTPKMILGTTTKDGVLYWSINNASGNPFAANHWAVTSDGTAGDICGSTRAYGQNVYACPDNGVTLTLSLGQVQP